MIYKKIEEKIKENQGVPPLRVPRVVSKLVSLNSLRFFNLKDF